MDPVENSGITEPASPAGEVAAPAPQTTPESSTEAAGVKTDSPTVTDGAAGVKEPGTALEALFKAREENHEGVRWAASRRSRPRHRQPRRTRETRRSQIQRRRRTADDATKPKKDAPARVKELLAERAEYLAAG